MTLRDVLAAATARIASRDVLSSDASRDAELLLLHALAAPRTLLYTEPDRSLTTGESRAYASLIDRRVTGEPIQYILGQQEFYGLTLHVTPAVLIPRPETELLVETVLHRLPRHEPRPSEGPLRILDVGTGSGAIAIALAWHLPQAQITAVDISNEALEIACENAVTHRLQTRVRFCHSDLLAALADEASFDVVVSNPPYIPESDRATLHTQVRDHEPAAALFAGVDGLAVYKRLIPQAFDALKFRGLLAIELGFGQRSPAAQLLDGWDEVEFIEDLQGIARVALARRPRK